MFKRKVIAIDLGGTNLRVSLVVNNKVVSYIKEKTPKTQDALLRLLKKNIDSLMEPGVRGIGVSSAGPLLNGVLKNPPHLPLQNFDLEGYLKKVYRKRVKVENDANCVALAESKLGCKKNNFFILTLGTGVGGGVIIEGKLYSGQGYGAELGHIIMDGGKDFESHWKYARTMIRKHFGRKLLVKDLLEKNDKNCKKILDYVSTVLARGIASHINVFDPEIVMLSGGISETGDKFLDQVRKKIPEYVIFPRIPEVKWSVLDHPGTLGASLLV